MGLFKVDVENIGISIKKGRKKLEFFLHIQHKLAIEEVLLILI